MIDGNRDIRRGLMLAVSLVALSAGMPARAQEAPSTSSLLEEMVATGVITQSQADKILKGAQARDAAKARAAAAQPQRAPARTAAARAPARQSTGATAASTQAVPASLATASSSRTADGTVHVQYVPQVVKDQIKDEVKQEVMAQAKDEGWAAPNQVPDWVSRIHIAGDVRVRGEGDMFPSSNATGTGDQINWGALNTRSTPLDVANLANFTPKGTSGSNAVPYNNWDKDRLRERLRARLGVDADLGDGFTTGIRIATGSDSSPVSTNQTLGGSNGDFSKYQLWLDRAYIRYDRNVADNWGVSAVTGRFANPFFSTDLIWNNDLNFDGVAISGHYSPLPGLTPFLTIGAFPVFNTDFNFSTYDEAKTSSQDRWLYGAQIGTDWKATPDTSVKVGAAYYYFDNLQGRQTDCYYLDETCASDVFRPLFAQHGNTYMDLRNNLGRTAVTDPNYQYFGLASGFHELALTGRVDYDGLRPFIPDQKFRVTVDGEFVKNLAFDKNVIQGKNPENNLSANTSKYDGGDTGAMLRVTVGTPALAKLWDWNVSLAYKYIESDAVVDAFNDSDFGLGGTNLKGFIVGGNLAFNKNIWASVRWMSADAIAGAPYSNDTVLVDLNAKF
jgi:hypothetical protein